MHFKMIIYYIVIISIKNNFCEIVENKILSETCKNNFEVIIHYLINNNNNNEQKCAAHYSSKLKKYKNNISNLFKNINYINFDKLYSSVWCSSSHISGLRCKFDNLCYFPQKRQFIFISSPFSILYGVNSLFELSKTLLTSSARNHTAFKFNFAVVGASHIKHKIRFIEKRLLLFSRFKPDNLQHVFHDDLLPLYFTIKELSINNQAKKNKNIIPIIIDENGKQEYDFLYSYISGQLYFINDLPLDNSWTCFLETHIGLNLMSVFYDYTIGNSFDNHYNYFNSNYLEGFVNHFIENFNFVSNSKQDVETLKVVILQRKATRKILNIKDVQEILFYHLKDKNNLTPIVKVMSLEDDGILSIIEELQKTEILIGMHGAALMLSIFMPNSSSLIELWPFGLKPLIVPFYKILCEIKGIHYKFWVNKDISNTRLHPEYPRYYGGIDNWSPTKLTDLIKKLEMTTLETIECCDNPEWLMRIYQDTIVNVYSQTQFKSQLLQKIVEDILSALKSIRPKISLGSNQFFLSKVDDVYCNIYHEKDYTKMILRWNFPWNYNVIECQDINFEIIVADSNTYSKGSYLTYYTSERIFMKKLEYNVFEFFVWITPICMEKMGSDTFVYCK